MCSYSASTVVDAFLAGHLEPVATPLADGVASPFVLVSGGDVADRGVQPDGVVLVPDAVQFSVLKRPRFSAALIRGAALG